MQIVYQMHDSAFTLDQVLKIIMGLKHEQSVKGMVKLVQRAPETRSAKPGSIHQYPGQACLSGQVYRISSSLWQTGQGFHKTVRPGPATTAVHAYRHGQPCCLHLK